LRQLECQYYSLLENAGYIATILDEEGVYVYGNPVAERYLGLKQGQLAAGIWTTCLARSRAGSDLR
jgi:PAS domain-containing protein